MNDTGLTHEHCDHEPEVAVYSGRYNGTDIFTDWRWWHKTSAAVGVFVVIFFAILGFLDAFLRCLLHLWW